MSKLKEFGKKLIYGRNDFSPKVKNILAEFGNEPITKIYIIRTPLSKPIRGLLNIVSLGAFEKKFKKTSADDLFHLAVHIETKKGRVSLEKNEVINMDKKPKRASNSQTLDVPLSEGLTLNTMLEETKQKMKQKFFPYSAYDNNCSVFIMNFLEANGLANSENSQFVEQEAKSLFSTHLRKIANTVTDVAAKIDVLKQGGSIQTNPKKNISTNTIMKHSDKERKSKELADVIMGSGFFDDIVSWTKKAAKTIDRGAKKTFTKKLGNQIARSAITAGVGAAGTLAGGPAGGIAGSVVGDQIGSRLIGKGMRKGRFEKGSPEALEWGRKMREARGL